MMAGQEPAQSGVQGGDWAPLPDDEFKDQLGQVIPHLRAFGRSLSGSRDLADDLVQETLLKAWAARKRFQAGTNMRAWTFIILRNLFLSQMRRARFKGEWDELTASKLLAAPASQDRHIELGDMQRALLHLPQPQREALILVGAGGFAYEEAAEICGCAVGTIKSRVARGRVALESLLNEGKLPSRRSHQTNDNQTALQSIMSEVDELSRDREPLGEDDEALVQPGEQILERLERTQLAVHLERLAQGLAHAGVDGGGSHLHEPTRRGAGHGLHSQIPFLHVKINVVRRAQLQLLRGRTESGRRCCMKETDRKRAVNHAIARARAHSPFLALQLDRFPISVMAALGSGGLDAALAAAGREGEAADVMAAVRRERSGHALALGIADLAGAIRARRG